MWIRWHLMVGVSEVCGWVCGCVGGWMWFWFLIEMVMVMSDDRIWGWVCFV